MKIRTAMIEDLKKITEVEAICFPAAEAASFENLGVSKSVHGGAVWYDMILRLMPE